MSEDKKDLGDKAEDAFDKAKDKANEFAEDAKESAKEFKDDTKEAAGEFKDEAKKTASEFSQGLKDAGGENKKVLVGILAIIFGSLGVHKFLLGYNKEGIILLVATIVGYATSCLGIGVFILMATGIVGLIEGIIYLTKSDEEFYNTYQVGKKPWF